MALGGAGGCIPLFVIPASRAGGNLGHTLPSMLPYTRWLDYCTVAYLVSEPAAKKNFMPVYHKLAALTEADVAPKREMLRRVRDAFVMRANSSVEHPAAPEYMLDEACNAARSLRRREQGLLQPAGGAHTSCTLG